jgi:hypothetical protein
MFERAVHAVFAAALGRAGERADLAGGIRCCDLCLHRYRAIALDGPLGVLPHPLAHAGVVVIDETIRDFVQDTTNRFLADRWTELLDSSSRDLEIARRAHASTLALLTIAVEELNDVAPLLDDLRKRQARSGDAAARHLRPTAAAVS